MHHIVAGVVVLGFIAITGVNVWRLFASELPFHQKLMLGAGNASVLLIGSVAVIGSTHIVGAVPFSAPLYFVAVLVSIASTVYLGNVVTRITWRFEGH